MATILRNLGVLFILLTALFCTLIVLATAVPNERIVAHLREAHTSFERNYFPSLLTRTQVDMFTDCVAVSNGIGSDRALSLWEGAIRSHAMGGCDKLASWLSDTRIGGFSYFRYWHGYSILTRPLLWAWGYDALLAVTAGILIIAYVALFVLISRKLGALSALCLAAALGLVGVDAAASSVVHSFSWSIAAAAGCWTLLTEEKRLWRPEPWFAIGAMTSFLELLNNPLVTLTLPLALALLRTCETKPFLTWQSLRRLALTASGWALGYFGLWLVKFALAWAMLGTEALEVIGHKALERLSGGAPYPTLATQLNLLQLLQPRWRFLVTLAVGAALLWRVVKLRSVAALFPGFALTLVAILPIIWLEVFANHSIVHAWFTFRIMAPSIWLALLAAAGFSQRQSRARSGQSAAPQ